MLLACMRMVCDTPAHPRSELPHQPQARGAGARAGRPAAPNPTARSSCSRNGSACCSWCASWPRKWALEFAWHTGSVPQERRRAEIARFKRDPGCRLFLSTDSGAVGLNLQAASAIINLDLPWNPARLEQRIARAWRKNQMRTVDVINLVTEDSIEHSMLHLLAQKQALADGVLDRDGDLEHA